MSSKVEEQGAKVESPAWLPICVQQVSVTAWKFPASFIMTFNIVQSQRSQIKQYNWITVYNSNHAPILCQFNIILLDSHTG